MNIFYIIGNGGFAKEVLFLAEQTLKNSKCSFGGFIDFQPKTDSVNIGNDSFPVLDENFFLENVLPSQDTLLYLGLGDTEKISKVVRKFLGYKFPNLIHPSVEYHRNSLEMGQGNIITAGSLLTVDIKIGNYNVFNLNTTIGHDTQIGDCNVFNPGANISGSIIIGDENLVGTNATILQGVRVGSRNKLGAACMVNKSIADELTMIGIPAKPLNIK
jgi:sugar O-acyltransferase (sialic acid O-acetyltransferase NeuD family)